HLSVLSSIASPLAMALVQTCEVDKKEASFLTSQIDDHTFTKALYNANGKCGEVGVSATKNLVTKCDFSMSDYCIPAPTTFKVGLTKKEIVVDIDAFCFNKDWYGLAIATNRPETEDSDEEPEQNNDGFETKKDKATRDAASASRSSNNVLLYVYHLNEFKLRRRIRVHGTISCMRVLISPDDMASQRSHLSAKIGLWPNVVAIGCKKSSCYLGQFSHFDPTNAEHQSSEDVLQVTATTDALRALVSDYKFNYGNSYFHKEEEDVTALAYIPCYGVVVVGMSNGCIVMVPLDGKSSISCLTVPYSTRINYLVVLEPEYDPQGGFFIFSARERPQGKINNAALCVFSHKIARQSDNAGGYEYQDMNSVMLPMKDGSYWINVHGIVKKRTRKDGDVSNMSTAETSHLPDGLNTTQQVHNDGMERTLMFYSYITLDGQMKGGLFDLNAFYSLRCGTQQVRFDEFGQHPICSQFTMKMPQVSPNVPLFRAKDISWVHCQDVNQFDSPFFDREPVFQPMSYTLDLRVYTYGKYGYDAVVHNLQHTVLDHISRSLGSVLAQPDVALALLERTGLVLAPATKRERIKNEERPANERVPKEVDKIMRALISDKHCRDRIVRFIETSEFRDRKVQLHIGRLMFNVLREIVERMDEAILPLFEATPLDSLSKDAKDIMAYCHSFFQFAETVFWKIRESGQKCGNDTHPLRHTRELHARMAFDLRLFFASATWMVRILPTSEDWTYELFAEMDAFAAERKEKSMREGYPLFLDAVLTRIHEKTQDDCVWDNAEDPQQWYPPRQYNLLWLIRQQEADRGDRLALLLYYLMDVDQVLRRNKQKPADERKAFTVKDGGSVVASFLACVADGLMGREGYNGVIERWESDVKGPPAKKEKDDDGTPREGELTKMEKEELTKLMKQPFRKLQKPDEDRIKALMMKQKWGEYRYNLYLIKKARYSEVEDLPDPGAPYESKAVEQYFYYKKLALYQKSQLPPHYESKLSHCPYVITKVAEKADVNTTMNESRVVRAAPIQIQGSAKPKKISIFKPAARVGRVDTTAASIQTTPTTGGQNGDVARINALMKTPSMRFRNLSFDEEEEENGGRKRQNDSDVVPDEIARVRETMRTPRSRANLAARAAAAAAAEGGGTPEAAIRTAPVPTSILKSAHKDSRVPQSATKSRLRFAKVFDEKSISPREGNNSLSTVDSMSQPNFDDSFDDGMEVLSHSAGSHSTDALSTTTRLQREIEEELERKAEGRPAEDNDHSSSHSMGDENEGMMDERMEEEEEG
ncbi:mel-28, partial [Pristionchus pacificus]